MPKTHDLADDVAKLKRNYAKTKHLPEGQHEDLGEDIIANMLLDLQNLKAPNTRRLELRSSGLPFCPIRKFLIPNEDENYSKEHYTSTGTAIHETLQLWAARSNYQQYMWGDWKCSACGEVKHRHCTKPQEACDCKSNSMEWLYVEVEIVYGERLTGHIDLILLLPSGRFIVCDFKTTYMEKKRRSMFWKADQPSSRSYVVQVRTYSTVLNLEYGMDIAAWHLITVGREQPITKKTDFSILSGEWSRKNSLAWAKHLDAAIDNFDNLQELNAAIAKNNRGKAKKRLKEMVVYRPCHDEASFKAWMHYGFFGKETCEFKGDCMQGSKAIHSRILTELRMLQRK